MVDKIHEIICNKRKCLKSKNNVANETEWYHSNQKQNKNRTCNKLVKKVQVYNDIVNNDINSI